MLQCLGLARGLQTRAPALPLLSSPSLHLSTSPSLHLSTSPCLHLSTTFPLARRIGKRVRTIPEFKRRAMESGPWWRKPPVVLASPLAATQHPADRWAAVEEEVQEQVLRASSPDLPVAMEDPFVPPPATCLLCPRKFSPGSAPVPHYRNPKLLSQFVSPHTGLVYDHHITGLCRAMQARVEKEVLRSQDSGFMSTRVKPRHYLQDPQLFNSSRPAKPNPF